jgi:hypothetical protein
VTGDDLPALPPLDRDKPLTEMTPDELRAGLAKPRTAAEWAMFASDYHRTGPDDGPEYQTDRSWAIPPLLTDAGGSFNQEVRP